MPEFKLVVSDTEVKEQKWVKVIVVGDENLQYGDEEKNQKRFMKVKISSRLYDILNPKLGIVAVRLWKSLENREKVNFIAQVEKDDSLEVGIVKAPLSFLQDKVGSERVLGEIARAPSFQIVVSGERASQLLGRRIGDYVDASIIGLPGYVLKITGGSDRAGAPMLPFIHGGVKKYVLLSGPPGFHPRLKGERRRKFVRGNMITEDTVQINTAIARKT